MFVIVPKKIPWRSYMKLFTRLMVGGLALALVLSLGAGTANAASKKKKAVVKKQTHEVRHVREKKEVIDGLNTSGKPGYFISDTAAVLNQNQIVGAAHLTFDSWGSVLQIPVGVSYGITDKLMVNVNTSFFTAGGVSGLYYLNFGGKYGFKNVGDTNNLDVAAGLDFGIGPLSNTIYGFSTFAFDPYGVVTYTLKDGLQLNGKLGLYVTSYSINVPYLISFLPVQWGTHSVSYSYSDFQLDLGAAYPFSRDLTGIAELATNGVVGNGASGGTPLLVGIRTGKDVQFQAFGGFDFGGSVGLFIGGGVAIFSK